MPDRALVTYDRSSIIRVAPAEADQLTQPVGRKPYWLDVIDGDKPPLGQNERHVATLPRRPAPARPAIRAGW